MTKKRSMRSRHRVSLSIVVVLLAACGSATPEADNNAQTNTGTLQSPLDGSTKLAVGTWTDLTASIVDTCRVWAGVDSSGSFGDELSSFVIEVNAVNMGSEPEALWSDVEGLVGADGLVVEEDNLLMSRPTSECLRDKFFYEYPDDVLPGFSQTIWLEFGDGPGYEPNKSFNFANLDSVVLLIRNPTYSGEIYYIKPAKKV